MAETVHGDFSRITYVEIDSTGAANKASFRTQIPRPVGYHGDEVVAFWIESIQIPHSFTQINANRDTFYIDRSGAKSITFEAAEYGNYSPDELATALQTELNSDDAGQSYTATWDENTFKFTITNGAGNSFTVKNSTAVGSSATSIHRILGFHSSSDTSSATSHTSDGVANGNLDTLLQVHIPDLRFGHPDNVVAHVPVTSNFGGVVFWDPARPVRHILPKGMRIGDLSIMLKHQDGTTDVDLNGNDWQMILCLEHAFKGTRLRP